MKQKKYQNEPKECLTCGKVFYRGKNEQSTNWRNRKYCSYKCAYNKNRNLRKKCEQCGKVMFCGWREGPSKFGKRRFCSIRCMSKWREKQYKNGKLRPPKKHKFGKNEKNPNWKGGITKLVEKIRKCKKYKEWRTCVYRRDNYTCQDCEKKGGDLEAHHKKDFAKIIEENSIKTLKNASLCKELWEVDNGITLCPDCHQKR